MLLLSNQWVVLIESLEPLQGRAGLAVEEYGMKIHWNNAEKMNQKGFLNSFTKM